MSSTTVKKKGNLLDDMICRDQYTKRLCKHTTTDSLDLFLSAAGNKLGANNDRLLRETTLGKNLVVAMLKSINNSNLLGVLVLVANIFTNKSPDLVKVDNGTMELVLGLVEVSHTDLTKVTRMVLVHVNTVMMLTTSKTATTRMLSVLS
jgi:hypothetical protein